MGISTLGERADVFQKVYFGKESVEGTAVAALTQFHFLNLMLEPNITVTEYRVQGNRFGVGNVPGKKWTSVKGAGSVACYDELAWLFDWMWGGVTPATPGGGTNSRTRTYAPTSLYETDPITATLKQGDKLTRAQRAAGSFLIGYQLDWDTDKVTITPDGLARKFVDDVQLDTNEVQSLIKTGTVAGGTFTLTLVNPVTGESATTATIAYNAAASAVQTALEALSNVEVGEVIAAGGPAPSVALTIEFRGRFGQANVTAMTVDNTLITGGGTMVLSTTTPGAAPTETTGIVIRPEHLKVYLDTSSGGIGGTRLTRCYGGSIKISNARGLEFTVDSANAGSAAAKVALPVTGTVSLNLAADAQGMGTVFTELDGSNNVFFLRLEAIGTLIEGSLYYTLYHDLAVQMSKAPSFSPNQGVYAGTFEFNIVHSSSWGKSMNIFLQNAVSTVA
jgi:hypothetical protein